ncbi:MAG: glucuronate isomerase [Flavobacterium sp.]|nr:glucuronate isomerase [Pedobacter sp.]
MNLEKTGSTFLNPDFLLYTNQAKNLYHRYAADLPIIDYHNHLPADEIASNKKFHSLTEIWLKGDHYKWRAMRAFGISEQFITGVASDEEKFFQWANMVPYTIRNPLFHWTQMELLNPFEVKKYLNKDSAREIYTHCNDLLQQDRFSTRSLLTHFKVQMVGTTDDPCDDLAGHRQLASEENRFKVFPTFRPDKILNISDTEAWFSYLNRLEKVSGKTISDISGLLSTLESRVEYFHQNGCQIADHGLSNMPGHTDFSIQLELEFTDFVTNRAVSKKFSSPDQFTGYILMELCRMYHTKGWVQQFHLGAIRNNNSKMYNVIGADAGFDSIGDFKQAQNLSYFLGKLTETDQLGKTILYNLNPSDNEVFTAMAGNFNDGQIAGKIQYGSGWWFLDQKDGIEKQLNTLSNLGLISTFIGMITDSRSFLSYSRHEYFRRILCNLFGNEMKKGELPDDEKWIGKIIRDICYYNAERYFNFTL